VIRFLSLLFCGLPAVFGQSVSSCDAFKQVTVKIDAAGETGAGVVMKSDGKTAWIATARHVVMAPSGDHVFQARGPIMIIFAGNAARSFAAKIQYPKPGAYSLSTIDIAVLEVSSPGQDLSKSAVEHFRTEELIQGEAVSFTGHPGELAWQCYKDTASISRLSYEEDDRKFVFASPQVQPGVSGGPVFDRQGRLIGIVTDKLERGTNAIAVRIAPVKRMMIDELAVGLADSKPNKSCGPPEGCTKRLGDLKLITSYLDEEKTFGVSTKWEEKVFELPLDWPFGRYLHFRAPNNDTAVFSTQVGFASTDRKGDADTRLIFAGATASIMTRGNDGNVYQVKLYKPGALEDATIEIKAVSATLVP
jgi:Trypsin-like peptidase domain